MNPCNISCLCIYFGLHVSYSVDISGFDIIFKQVSVLIDYFAFSSKTCSQANKFTKGRLLLYFLVADNLQDSFSLLFLELVLDIFAYYMMNVNVETKLCKHHL